MQPPVDSPGGGPHDRGPASATGTGSDIVTSPRISVIIPVYNEVSALEATVEELRPHLPAETELVLVDDGSTDGSGPLVDELSRRDDRIRAVHHVRNAGYGQALKTGASYAHGEFLVFFDSDGQHDPGTVPRLVDAQRDRDLDMVVGKRIGQARATPIRAPAKWILARVANVLARTRIPDLNSGLRLIRRSTFVRFQPLLPQGFSLSTTLTISCLKLGVRTEFVDTPVRARTGKSTVRFFRDGYRTVLLIIRLIALFDPLTFFLPIALLLILAGVGYGTAVAILVGRGFPTAALFVGLTGVLAFLLGIVCDQISALRIEYLQLRDRVAPSREGP
jgi:glycosyltransferase involved in cell wall biosynthesis